MPEEMLGDEADFIEIIERKILLEIDGKGWIHSVCLCGVKMSSENRTVVDDWAKHHASRCGK